MDTSLFWSLAFCVALFEDSSVGSRLCFVLLCFSLSTYFFWPSVSAQCDLVALSMIFSSCQLNETKKTRDVIGRNKARKCSDPPSALLPAVDLLA